LRNAAKLKLQPELHNQFSNRRTNAGRSPRAGAESGTFCLGADSDCRPRHARRATAAIGPDAAAQRPGAYCRLGAETELEGSAVLLRWRFILKSTSTTSWRDQLQVHEAAEEFTVPTEAELQKLADDIAANGLQNKVKIQRRDGRLVLLDGRSRLDALELNDRTIDLDDTSIFEVVAETVDPVAYIIGANILRRHLTGEQRQDLLIKLIARAPEKSDRQIAKEAGVDHKTLAKARAKGQDVGSIPHVAKRIDSKGRKQPATKVRKPEVAASPPPAASPAAISPATASPEPLAPLAVQVLPPPVALPLGNTDVDPDASAAARKAAYAAAELQPAAVTAVVTNTYSANRIVPGTSCGAVSMLTPSSETPIARGLS
jgi:hypothetical protein